MNKKSRPLPPGLTAGHWSKPLTVEPARAEEPDDPAGQDDPDASAGLLARTSREVREQRYALCRQCEHFIGLTRMCSRCACLMPAKTWLRASSCPAGKWGKA